MTPVEDLGAVGVYPLAKMGSNRYFGIGVAVYAEIDSDADVGHCMRALLVGERVR